MLAKIVIQRCPANAESAGNFCLRDISIHPFPCLGKLLISQCFRATFINPAGFRPSDPLSLTLANNRPLKLRNTPEQAKHELG